jgi:hypothetical protein
VILRIVEIAAGALVIIASSQILIDNHQVGAGVALQVVGLSSQLILVARKAQRGELR